MADSDLPRSPFAGMADLGARQSVRVLSSEEITRMLASHRIYRETEYHEGRRANFSLVDLTGKTSLGSICAALKWIALRSEALICLELICKGPI